MIAFNDAGGSTPKKKQVKCDLCGKSAKGGVNYDFPALPSVRVCMLCLVSAALDTIHKQSGTAKKGPGDCD